MAQYDFQMTDFERIFRKRYKLMLAVAFWVIAFTIIFGRMKPSRYSATSTVKIDRNTMTGYGMESIMWSQFEDIETQTRVITSYPVLLRAAIKLDLVDGGVIDSLDEHELVENPEIALRLNGLKGKIKTNLSGNTNIVSIQAESGNPEEVRDIANAMATAYREYAIYKKKRHAAKVKSFISQELERSKAELLDAELAVRAFEESQEIPSLDVNARKVIGEAADTKQELIMVDEALTTIRQQKNKLSQRLSSGDYQGLKDELTKKDGPLEDGTSSEEGAGDMTWISQFTDRDPGLNRLNNRLIALQIELDDQLTYYHEEHPSAKDIRKKIKETMVQMVAEYGKKQQVLTEKKAALSVARQELEEKMRRLPASQMQYSRLLRALKVSEQLTISLTQKLQEVQITEAGVVDDVTIMSLATVPTTPINKDMSRTILIGVFLGLLLGTLLAVIREMFDSSIGTIEDVERTLKVTVLAVIPHIQLEEQQKRLVRELDLSKRELTDLDMRARLVTQFDPKKPIAEAYRILRTNIEYLSAGKDIKTIHITSATMQEGKSTTISNLAVAFAQQGKKVLLLECNLRRPSLYKTFGIEKAPGMTDVLIQNTNWHECVKTVTDIALGDFSIKGILSTPGLENLSIITYGQTPPNPAELLSSNAMDKLLAEVREEYDVVLVDAPPLLPVADSMVISTKVDGVILVYKVGSAPRNSLALARERLQGVNANVLGIVLNDIRPETSGISYSRMYARYYGKEQKNSKSRSSVLKMASPKA